MLSLERHKKNLISRLSKKIDFFWSELEVLAVDVKTKINGTLILPFSQMSFLSFTIHYIKASYVCSYIGIKMFFQHFSATLLQQNLLYQDSYPTWTSY